MTMTLNSLTAYRNLAANSLSPVKALAQLASTGSTAALTDRVTLSGGETNPGAAGIGRADPVQAAQAAAPAADAAGTPFSTSVNHEIKRSGEGYKAEATYPQITGGPAEEVRAIINRLIEAEVTSAVNEFEIDAKGEPPMEGFSPSELTIDFNEVTNNDRILSINSGTYHYPSGAAHGSYGITSHNFDVQTGHTISMRELFRLDDYVVTDSRLFIDNTKARDNKWVEVLTAISDYCIKDLKSQWTAEGVEPPDDEWLRSGAGPEEGNFSTFNITDDGLVIQFGQYQVSCYADGMRSVKIPFDYLEKHLDPQGALGQYAKPEPQQPPAQDDPSTMDITDDMIIIDDVMLRKNRAGA
jgi:hypothetical protein